MFLTQLCQRTKGRVIIVKYLHLVRQSLIVIFSLQLHSSQASYSYISHSHIMSLDVGKTASNLWSSALTQSHEFAQSCITSQRNSTQQCYRDATEDAKNSDWSASPYSATLNNQMVFPVEQKKPETTASYRLFGIDLLSSSIPATEEKTAPTLPINITKPTPDSNSDPKSEVSKLSEEKKQEPAQASSKEVQSKEISSTRSRTKVCYEHFFMHIKHTYLLFLYNNLRYLYEHRCKCKAYRWAGLWI